MAESSVDPKAGTPKVFISYSWTSMEHIKRVLSWAEKLTSDGVHVVIDKWDLVEGQDKHAFMEQMVLDPSISKVLVFSDLAYETKANARHGGVGTESQIISQETYGKVAQTKFIPIVCEFRDSKACLPVFLQSRIYIDFSSPVRFQEEYEKLVRHIYNKPLFSRPRIGAPPQYLDQQLTTRFPSRYKLERYKDAVENDRSHFRGIAREYLQAVMTDLLAYAPLDVPDGTEIDDAVILKLRESLPLRDDIVDFCRVSTCYKDDADLYVLIREWFESAASLVEAHSDKRDHIAFLVHELFLYYVAILVQNKRYPELKNVLEHQYAVRSPVEQRQLRSFECFRSLCRILEQTRKQRLKLNRLSITADLLKERATVSSVTFEEIRQADGVLFLKTLVTAQTRAWYPLTLVYARYNEVFNLFFRAASRRQFSPIAVLFSVSSKEELLERYNEGFKKHQVGQWSDLMFRSEAEFETLFNFDKLGSLE